MIAGLRDNFPAIRSLESRPNNLPRQLTPVVGREQEIKTGCRLLLEEDTALVSLTGPGGTGKTRLALALGQELLDSFAHGVFFVDLSTTIDPSLLASAPGLKVLVTTREPLRLRGERELQVPPLDLPDSQHSDPVGAENSIRALTRSFGSGSPGTRRGLTLAH